METIMSEVIGQRHINMSIDRSLENKTRMTIKGKRYRVGNPNHPYYNLYCEKGFDAVFQEMGLIKNTAKNIRRKVLALYDNHTQGDVYIISNPAWKGWYKIGMAIDAEDRCSQYQTSSPFRDFKVEFFTFFNDRRTAETKVHLELVAQNILHKGEWFKTNLEKIKTVIKKVKENDLS